MMTPQEVASHAFAKAKLGGYNMAMVDEFLDALTEDYTALYNDNAILKGKLKTLSDTVEQYRATDDAMRKTLLAAQKMADTMVADAEAKKDALLHDAEATARQRIEELKSEIAAEEFRLRTAQEATAAYAVQAIKILDAHREFLLGLDKLMLSGQPVEEAVEAAVSEIEEAVVHLTSQKSSPSTNNGAPPLREQPIRAQPNGENDTRIYANTNSTHFEHLEFGHDYTIT